MQTVVERSLSLSIWTILLLLLAAPSEGLARPPLISSACVMNASRRARNQTPYLSNSKSRFHHRCARGELWTFLPQNNGTYCIRNNHLASLNRPSFLSEVHPRLHHRCAAGERWWLLRAPNNTYCLKNVRRSNRRKYRRGTRPYLANTGSFHHQCSAGERWVVRPTGARPKPAPARPSRPSRPAPQGGCSVTDAGGTVAIGPSACTNFPNIDTRHLQSLVNGLNVDETSCGGAGAASGTLCLPGLVGGKRGSQRLKVCNHTTSKFIDVAIGYYYGKRTWRSEGWRRIFRGKCSTWGFPGHRAYYYVYAKGQGRRWSGPRNLHRQMCVSNGGFKFLGRHVRCPRGSYRIPFRVIRSSRPIPVVTYSFR